MRNLFRLVSLNAARLLFVGGLLLALYAGLVWALAPEDRPDAESIARAQAQLDALASEVDASESASEQASPGPSASPSATPEAVPETISPQQLIADAKDPAETTIQVLDAGGGGARVDEAIALLQQFGYNIVARSPSSRKVSQTTVYFVGEAEPEAEAVRARDPRFQLVESNQDRLSNGVDLHVLVGPEF